MKNADLWARICVFSLDDKDSAFDFTTKLMSENNWTRSFTKAIVGEFKNSCYLRA